MLCLPTLANAGWFTNDTAPKCSDLETQELVIQIMKDGLEEDSGKEFADSLTLVLSLIRTTDFNEKTGSQECAAELTMSNSDDSGTIHLTYTSELLDDGENFYVTVH
mgnify:FL=1